MDEYREFLAGQSKSYFQHIRELRSLERLYSSSLESVREIVRGIDYTRPSVSHTTYTDAVPDAVAQLEALESRYTVTLSEFAYERARAEEIVGRLDDARYRAVLTYYYLNALPWRVVADEDHMCYDIRHCMRLAEQALAAVYFLIPNEWRKPIPRAY